LISPAIFVSTGGMSGISQNAATLSGTVSTNGLQTNYGFEIGTEPNNCLVALVHIRSRHTFR